MLLLADQSWKLLRKRCRSAHSRAVACCRQSPRGCETATSEAAVHKGATKRSGALRQRPLQGRPRKYRQRSASGLNDRGLRPSLLCSCRLKRRRLPFQQRSQRGLHRRQGTAARPPPGVPPALPHSQPWLQCRCGCGLMRGRGDCSGLRCRAAARVICLPASVALAASWRHPGVGWTAVRACPLQLRELDHGLSQLTLLVLPVVQEEYLECCQRTASFHIQGLEEMACITSEAKDAATLAKFGAAHLP
mmetsp:Transcript_65579/g.174686  ORF Transcript_65579/g.174686 Transcript_65579/m.174686 type:complete len:248 (-) Transcript_65579:117-860(-)